MSAEEAWGLIVNSLMNEAREFNTIPSNKRKPIWFHARISKDKILVSKAEKNIPSSAIQAERVIRYKEFFTIYNYYSVWKNDPSIRKEIKSKSQNIAYIFSLIADITDK